MTNPQNTMNYCHVPQTAVPTLRQLIGEYIDNRRNVLSPATIRGYDILMRQRFQSVSDTPVTEIKNWQAVINTEAVLCGAKTLGNAWGLVSSALSAGGYEIPKVSLPKIMPSTRPWLTPEQIPIFIEAVRGAPCEIPALLALHSLRRSEIAALTWKHIDLKNGLIHVMGSAVPGPDNQVVYKATTKSRNSFRTVPIMIPELTRALTSVPIKKRVGLLITCNPNTILSQINRVCESVGFPKVGGARSASQLRFAGAPHRTSRRRNNADWGMGRHQYHAEDLYPRGTV